MPSRVLVAIPVKPFGIAKARLSPVLDSPSRRTLGQSVLAHTIEAVRAAGAEPAVVTGDQGVAGWSAERGVETIAERGSGLDGAARSAVQTARERRLPWLILHADLPLLSPDDLQPVLEGLRAGRTVIAPSRDRGTNALGSGLDDFPFSYGPDSFGRHQTAAARLSGEAPLVVVQVALALDLDGPDDLAAVRALPAGAWVDRSIG